MCLVVKVTREELTQGYWSLLKPPGWDDVSTELELCDRHSRDERGRPGWGVGAARCVDPGSSPRGTMESGEISSDYLINGLRLQEVAARISLKVESRED